ncbi:MAG: Crp/Fnr family transcriptional regulator [Halocynthiibacter sp.]
MTWVDKFDGLARLAPAIKAELLDHAKIMTLPKDTVVFGPGKAPENMLFLLSGAVRVSQTSENGREIVLYRVRAGESCVLTTACLLAYEDYSAEGVTEETSTAAAVPRHVFDDLIASSPEFRAFVFRAYSKRITNLFVVIEEVAFQRIDIRLAHKLVELMDAGHSIASTHHQMAIELGTAREVVSRQLQEFQRRGWVHLSRGSIQITDLAAVQGLANSH